MEIPRLHPTRPVPDFLRSHSLQLSTSIARPMNSYHRYRTPEQSHRPRFSMDMQQKRPAMPTRTYSHDALPPKPVSNPIYQSHRVPGTSLQTTIAQHNERPATSVAFTPKSMDIDQSYFAPCVTPESQARQDLWDNALGIDTAVKDNQDLVDFGLGLGPLTTNFTPPSTINEDATLLMPSEYVRPTGLACDTGSPEDGQSWSTLSESSGGLLSDFPDMSPDVANAPAFNADYTTGYDQLMSMNEPTPTATNPMYSRPPSRAFVDASPRHSFRASPYPSQASRSRSFSAGHPALARSHRGSPVPHMSYHRPYASVQASPLSTSNSSIIEGADFDSSNVTMFSQPSLFDDLQTHANLQYQLHEYPTRESSMASSPPKLASSIYDAHSHSHGHSHPPSIASTKCEHHFAGSSVAPDLFGPLSKTPASPPPEDMICESEADIPRSQELRFDGDLYTPKYVRGHGNKREGWCGICSRWLVLKNSAFWYDKSFSHGISAATGSAFEAPRETRRMKSNPDVWEGFCGSCGEWVALISSKKKGTTWFRHAYKVCSFFLSFMELREAEANECGYSVILINGLRIPRSAEEKCPLRNKLVSSLRVPRQPNNLSSSSYRQASRRPLPTPLITTTSLPPLNKTLLSQPSNPNTPPPKSANLLLPPKTKHPK